MIGSNTPGIDALETNKKRWGIEVLFANLKRRGFDLEQTQLTVVRKGSNIGTDLCVPKLRIT